MAKPDLPDDLTWESVYDSTTSGAFCSSCGNLWIHWDEGLGSASEYVAVDPAARPVRRPAAHG